jgi:hypothetical protein
MPTTLTKNEMLIEKIGPVCVVMDDPGENFATFQVCYNQAGRSTCVMTKWEIDGFVESLRLTGTNDDWRRYWETFLGFLPTHMATEIAQYEDAFLRDA